jgi:predicted transposase YbfD/YdcC
MTKEKKVPKYIRNGEVKHPGSNTKLIQILENFPDPRGASCNFKHPLTTILFITIVCSLCGANDWEVIMVQAQAMNNWLSKYVDLSNGVPCVRTFKRLFETICPDKMEAMLIEVMEILREKKKGDVISFDGKTLRGTSASEKGLKGIHILNAWSKDNGICIGQTKVDDKSNEITAMPELMDLLDLKGTIITADALNTQKKTASKAIEKEADYFLPVKGNQPFLQEEIELLFNEAEEESYKGFDADNLETIEKAHGRVESRKYYSLDAEDLPSAQDWKGMNSVGKVIRERTEKGKTTKEIHYYISSCEVDAGILEMATRSHWGVENGLHWALDVVFREDKLRYRERNGARNLSIIRKITLGALGRDKTLKCGKEGKRLAAATDSTYRENLLKNLF